MSLNPSICPTSAVPNGRIAHILDVFSTFDMLRGAAVETVTRSSTGTSVEHNPPLDYMREWTTDADTDNAIGAPAHPARREHNTAVIELLDDALDELRMTWTPSAMSDSAPPTPMKQCANIADVSRAFTLNEKQHYAVKMIGMALVTRWRNAEALVYMNEEMEKQFRSDQLQMFLGGEGGTGKSRVIGAIQALCESWGHASSIVKTALTGKAATIIGGRTLARFLLQLQRKTSIEAVMNLDVIVIDEVSMMKKSQLTQMDTVLRNAKRIPNVAFGGIHVVLDGDFLQLPPVGADPIFRDPMKNPKCTANDIAGYQLWSGFQDVIVLEESVRFRLDPEWGHGCRKTRRGVWTPEFVSIINSRVVSRDGSLSDWLSDEQAAKFVTPDNSTRLAINNLFISSVAKALPSDEYPVRVVANFKGKLAALSAAEVKMMMSVPDTKFGRMPPYLDLIVGMPVQVTQNIRPQKMVANGTLGVLEAILYEPGTSFRLVHDQFANMVVKIPSVPPPAVLVRIQRGDMAARMQGFDDADLFPLFF